MTLTLTPDKRSCIVCGELKTQIHVEIRRAEQRRARLLEPKNLDKIDRLKAELDRCEHTHYGAAR